MIQDMSFPQNDPNTFSVNHGINSDDFPTAWGSFDAAANLILSLPPGCQAATFNISAAYCLTPTQPSQQHHLCVFWKGLVYVDCAIMFGLASSAGVFGAIADMLTVIYKVAGFEAVIKWVDNFLAIHLPHQMWTEQEFMDLTAYFGVPWSLKKMRPLATTQHYIGFDWNLNSHMVAIPEEKLSKLLSLLSQWLQPTASFSAQEAASLHEKSVHFSCLVHLIHPFLQSIAHFTTRYKSP
jgi:hypothetical protein